MTYQLIPEWAPQEAVLLAWPDSQTDWKDNLDEVQHTYVLLMQAINKAGAAVLLLTKPTEITSIKPRLAHLTNIVLVPADYNDTWVRDFGFLTLSNGKQLSLQEFQFNGWGKKFNAELDNAVNQRYLARLLNYPIASSKLVCEGGALEIDADGHLLSTHQCLNNPYRNGTVTMREYREHFQQLLGATEVSIFTHGHLHGDDTDGHIDTLVRFTPDQGVVIQSCFNRPNDAHYEGLTKLVAEVKAALPARITFELPLPEVYNHERERLPASYANYLICNGHILCPTYRQPEDQQALAVIGQAHPDFKIVAIDCWPLVQQFGSLHCVTMQIPTGVLKAEVTELFNTGVTLL